MPPPAPMIDADDVEDWRTRGNCYGYGSLATFDPWYDEEPAARQLALDACRTCPVRGHCLTDGITERDGIWGGYTPKDRERLRAALERVPAPARPALIRKAAELGRDQFHLPRG